MRICFLAFDAQQQTNVHPLLCLASTLQLRRFCRHQAHFDHLLLLGSEGRNRLAYHMRVSFATLTSCLHNLLFQTADLNHEKIGLFRKVHYNKHISRYIQWCVPMSGDITRVRTNPIEPIQTNELKRVTPSESTQAYQPQRANPNESI